MSACKFKTVALAIFVLALFFELATAPCMAASMEIRGTAFDTGSTATENISWDFNNFGVFCFNINKYSPFSAGSGEHLYLEDKGDSPSIGKANPEASVIDEGELIYTTRQFPSKYKVFSEEEDVTKVSYFYTLALFGKSYCAIDNDATLLSKILFKQGGSDKMTMKTGDSWELAGGYSLLLNGVDVNGDKCYFSLYKDDREIESAVVDTAGTVDDRIFTAKEKFGDSSKHIYFLTYVDSVFAGPDGDIAVFKYTWLMDKDKSLPIESGDGFGKFEVDQALENLIVMSNTDSININVDMNSMTYFTDEWYFRTSDEGKGTNGGYVIYPAKKVTLADQNPTTPEAVNVPENDAEPESVIKIIEEEKSTQGSSARADTAKNPGETEETEETFKSSPSASEEESEPSDSDSETSSTPGFGLTATILSLAGIRSFRRS